MVMAKFIVYENQNYPIQGKQEDFRTFDKQIEILLIIFPSNLWGIFMQRHTWARQVERELLCLGGENPHETL